MHIILITFLVRTLFILVQVQWEIQWLTIDVDDYFSSGGLDQLRIAGLADKLSAEQVAGHSVHVEGVHSYIVAAVERFINETAVPMPSDAWRWRTPCHLTHQHQLAVFVKRLQVLRKHPVVRIYHRWLRWYCEQRNECRMLNREDIEINHVQSPFLNGKKIFY